MNEKDKLQLVSLYENRFDQFGYNVHTVGWGDNESQNLRFKILSEIDNLNGKTICDLGCGFGDLYKYLTERFVDIEYVGIDIAGKLICEAKKQYPSVAFQVRDILITPFEHKFDYFLSSGALSFKTENHKQYVETMLTAMMDSTTKGIAVNFLSSYVDYQLDKNFHFSPEEAFSMARKLSRFVTIRHDYPLYEFTVYIYHYSLCAATK